MTPVVLAADPPWHFADKLPGKSRGASKNYQTLSLEDIKGFALPLQVVRAPDAVLFLWRVSAMQQEALDVARAWDFHPYTELIWQKLSKTGTKKHFGLGHILRASHETCMVCVRGKALPDARNIRSTFEAPVGLHSEKPQAFYRLVEKLYPHAHRYEIFSRRPRVGWAQYGNQLGMLEHEQLTMNIGGDDGHQATG